MTKIFIILFISFPVLLIAQNVGIGTNTPSAKLEVKNSLLSRLKVSSTFYTDTTEMVFSNRDNSNQGTDFSIKAVREEGLFFSTTSDLGSNNSSNSLVIKPNGNVGIGVVPLYKFHINGVSRLNGPVQLEGLNLFEFGAGVAGKEVSAGKIGYNAFGQNALTFVGAGTNSTNRAIYFFAEGGTVMNGSLDIGGTLKVNGNAGTSGQVLTSNGAADPVWRNSSFGNTTRFALSFTNNASFSGNFNISSTYYNLNPADVAIGSSVITINKSGLYHFDVGAYGSLNFASATTASPILGIWLFFGLPSPLQLIDDRRMTAANTANTFFSATEKVSVEVYIAAPASISLYHTFNTLGIGGGASAHSATGFLTGHLISE